MADGGVQHWPRVALGEVLRLCVDAVRVDPLRSYPTAGVYSHNRGLFSRGELVGSQSSYSEFYRLHAGDFLVSRVKGWEGAVGVVPAELDGHYVSKEFPSFRPDSERLDVRWLNDFFKTSSGRDALAGAAKGIGARRERVKETEFLRISIPLPSFEEQRRIVARVEALCAKVDEALRLREEMRSSPDDLQRELELCLWPADSVRDAPRLADVTTFLARGRQSRQGMSGHVLIKTQHVQMRRYVNSALTLASDEAAKVSPEAIARPDDILIACSAAGCLGRVARYEGGDRPASTDTHVAIARPKRDVVLPEYLYAYLVGAQGQVQLRSRERGDWQKEKIGFRLVELNVADMRNVPVPVPSVEEQKSIVARAEAARAYCDQLRSAHEQICDDLAALRSTIIERALRGEL